MGRVNDIQVGNLIVTKHSADCTVSVGPASLRHPSFQERAHSSSVQGAVRVGREDSSAGPPPKPMPAEAPQRSVRPVPRSASPR